MKIKRSLFAVAAITILFSSCGQKMSTNVKLESNIDTVSYMLGVDIANSLNANSFTEVNTDAFMEGLVAKLNEKDLKVNEDDIRMEVQKFFTKKRNEKFQKNLEEGNAFLEENKKRDGVIETESGLQYEIIEEGTGESPDGDDLVKCHYHGTLIDGTVFDSSVERGEPMEFALNRVVPGWTEGIQLMKEGGKIKLYLPSELGYGQNPRPGGLIEPNMALIFEVELIEVKKQDASNPATLKQN